VEQCVKNQLILLKTLRAEAFGVTLPQVKIAYNRWRRVGRLSLEAREPIRLRACHS